MSVLVTGAGGQLGHALVDTFAASGKEVIGLDHAALDVADRDQVLSIFAELRPEVVVHAAAWTDVDGCEADVDRAFAVNALGTRYVAEGAGGVGARVCYVSTDYVFDGKSGVPYNEWDAPNPLSVYGRSKLAGERELDPQATIVRTSWVCGRHGRNFVKSVVGRARAGETLTVVDDQHGCPTFADDLAEMVCRLVSARRTGIHHVTNQGATTWYQLACDALMVAGLSPTQVVPISTADLQPPRPAPRPVFSVLDNAALRLGGIALLDDHHVGLERLVRQLIAVPG